MSFKNAVLNTVVETTTENGMKAYESSLRHTTDLFYNIGASRGKNIIPLFEKAYHENSELALRIAQWGRDVRGGAGERELFRQILLFLEKNYNEELLDTKLLRNIPEIGRWDDLLVFVGTSIEFAAFSIIAEAFENNNGLCAKWMPRKGEVAVKLRNYLGWSPKYYRKRLVELTKVVETQMCAKNWNEINFSHVPSLAMSRYSKAFGRNAPESFAQYKESLKKGDPSVKVNAGAVYPYDIVKNVRHGDSALADEQWKALPNFIGDAMVLPLVDVSGSMTAPVGGNKNLSCMDVSIALGLYCSEKNTGAFQDLFLTFSDKPTFVHVKGNLSARVRQMESSSWGYNTNLNKAFDEILKVAVKNSVEEKDMPKVLLILSDMQFDQSDRSFDETALEMIKGKYADAGYEAPAIVFWNLRATDNVPVRFDQMGTAMVSGCSPAIMKAVLEGDFESMTPEAMMLKAVASNRYDL